MSMMLTMQTRNMNKLLTLFWVMNMVISLLSENIMIYMCNTVYGIDSDTSEVQLQNLKSEILDILPMPHLLIKQSLDLQQPTALKFLKSDNLIFFCTRSMNSEFLTTQYSSGSDLGFLRQI